MTDRPIVVVSGASIAGTATAFWFSRLGWRVVLLERASTFRTGGQNVDVRGTARDVLDRMGLTGQVREHGTTEVGTRFVDESGASVGEFPVPEGGGDGPTAELEILRGDLAQLVADALPETVEWVFDDVIASLEQDEGGVDVRLRSGRTLRADLLVVAEGVRSSTRGLVLADEVERHELGMTIAYGTIPRTDADDRWWRWLTVPGSRQATLRPDNHETIRATLGFLTRDRSVGGDDRAALVAALREVFDGVGWEVPRILDGFATSDDVYVDALTQIEANRWSTGRVVLTGDAAWCVTPLGGGGSSLALVGAYVLAASVSHHDAGGDGLGRALGAYEAWMRPLVEKVQDLPPGVPRLALPASEVGVAVQRRLTRIASNRWVQKAVGGLAGGGLDAPAPLPELSAPAGSG